MLTYFNPDSDGVEYEILTLSNNTPVLAVKEFTGEELLTIGNIVNSITVWARDMSGDFPIAHDATMAEEHRQAVYEERTCER